MLGPMGNFGFPTDYASKKDAEKLKKEAKTARMLGLFAIVIAIVEPIVLFLIAR